MYNYSTIDQSNIEYLEIAPASELPPGQRLFVEIEGKPIVIFNIAGQHFSIASPAVPWLECFVGSPPGVPIEETWGLPGVASPKDGWLVPNGAPGFGLEVQESWLAAYR